MKNVHRQLLLVGMMIVFGLTSSCSSSRKVNTYRDLENARDKGDPVRILTTDSKYYTFDTFTYNDSTITGEGSRDAGGSEQSFRGSLNFDDIVFMERLKKNGWKGLWLVPVAYSLAGGVISLMQPPNFEIRRPEGSCPFLYAYDGNGYRLEAEAFSTAISKALEAQTFHVLPSLKSTGGDLKVRISNERPETHLFNSVKLYAVDSPPNSEVVLDITNRAWALGNTASPMMAKDLSGSDVTADLYRKDGRFWKSSRKSNLSHSGFRDTLLVTFEGPMQNATAMLRVDAINSTLINEIYSLAGSLVGEETLGFYHTLEQDTVLQNYFREWVDRSSLKVEVKKETGWEEAGRILPEANEVVFARALRLELEEDVEGPLALRISSMANVWHVDAISVDFSASGPLTMEPVPLTSLQATGPAEDRHMLKAISANDSMYAMILPPDYIDLTFDADSTGSMEHPNYIMAAQGYLYEWLPGQSAISENIIPSWFRGMSPKDKLALFTQKEDVLVQTIYNRWQQGKDK